MSVTDHFQVLRAFEGQIPEPVAQWLKLRFGGSPAEGASSGLDRGPHPSGISLAQLESPMMKQFASAKLQVPDALLFFRMGDFFELFGIDAVIAAHVCRLTLTSRDKGAEDPVPMAGVPVVSVKSALKKCVEAGFKVAVCDQVEDPRDAKALVKREIVRVLTPAVSGDLFEEEEASPGGSYLGVLLQDPSSESGSLAWTLAAVDAATGVLTLVTGSGRTSRDEELLALSPQEVLLPECDFGHLKRELAGVFSRQGGRLPTFVPLLAPSPQVPARTSAKLERIYPPTGASVESFRAIAGVPRGPEAVVALAEYVTAMQRSAELPAHWKPARVLSRQESLILDSATRSHLALFGSVHRGGSSRAPHSFFQFLNQCVTTSGQRKLYERLSAPFATASAIVAAQDMTESLVRAPSSFVKDLRAALCQCSDLDRLLARLVLGSGAPREVLAVRRTLQACRQLGSMDWTLVEGQGDLFRSVKDSPFVTGGEDNETHPLLDLLERAICHDADAILGKGQFFREGYDDRLDEYTRLSTGIEAQLEALQTLERERTGIATLKIGYNRVFGYYFEVSKGKAAAIPASYVRKQTLTNAERFITQELKELEDSALSADDKRQALERELFAEIVARIVSERQALSALNDLVATLDLHCCFARLAEVHQWTRPVMLEEPRSQITSLVHPVLAHELAKAGQGFVPNDVALGAAIVAGAPGKGSDASNRALSPGSAILLITGPNMAGKSTIMRQVALAHILAQMGSFVPAAQAEIGICDKIFTRIGAGDDVMGARSTFMVEMSETAQILSQATPRSLILMDEIGRGTSTWDGLALAWSILEHLDGALGARTLFSTHYHELSHFCGAFQNTTPMQVEVMEDPKAVDPNDRIVFTHRFVPGSATESYGIHVARLAGLPESVIARAAHRLRDLTTMTHQRPLSEDRPSRAEHTQCERTQPDMVPEHSDTDPTGRPNVADAVVTELCSFDINRCSPLEAMNQLAAWQEILRQESGQQPSRSPRPSSLRGRAGERGRHRQTMADLFDM